MSWCSRRSIVAACSRQARHTGGGHYKGIRGRQQSSAGWARHRLHTCTSNMEAIPALTGAHVSMVGARPLPVPVPHITQADQTNPRMTSSLSPRLSRPASPAPLTPGTRIPVSSAPLRLHDAPTSIKTLAPRLYLPRRALTAVVYDAISVRSPPGSKSCPTGPCQASRTWTRVGHFRVSNLIASTSNCIVYDGALYLRQQWSERAL